MILIQISTTLVEGINYIFIIPVGNMKKQLLKNEKEQLKILAHTEEEF